MRRSLPTVVQPVADAGPAWTWVTDPRGRRYLSDEFNHRIVIEEPDGRSWTFGQRGAGAGAFRFPRGLALVPGATAETTRIYVADTWNHRIQVFDGNGQMKFAFGGLGNGRGQFRAPADLVIARPEMPWEGDVAAPAVLVVADQWNGRLQVFELDGTWLATFGGRNRGSASVGGNQDVTGWPFFRTTQVALPRDPSRLSWQAPYLVVTGGNGRNMRVDLAAALLPEFEEWQREARTGERAHALRYFGLLKGQRRALPADLFAALPQAPDAA